MKKKPPGDLLTGFSNASTQAFEPTSEFAMRLRGRVVLWHVVVNAAIDPG